MRTARVDISPFDPRKHGPRTKGARGACSWTEDCEEPQRYTVIVDYLDTGERRTFAICDGHIARVREVYAVPG